MNEFNLFELARKYWKPTSLAALVLFILFLTLKGILSLDIFSRLGEDNTFRLLNTLSIGVLLLAFVALIIGVTSYLLNSKRTTKENIQNLEEVTSRPLPTFEIGICTEGSPFQMECTGEIIRGVDAATRVVEEIELYTKPVDSLRFDVRVRGIDRIRNYLAGMTNPIGEEIEIHHKLQMALKDWETHRDEFQIGVEFILWNPIFRKTAGIYDARGAAETICGLSENCFAYPKYDDIAWWLWYDEEKQTRDCFLITKAIEESMDRGFWEYDSTREQGFQGLQGYKAYPIGNFDPHIRNKFVLPKLLIFVAAQKIKGASQITLDKYLDVSKWRWSINDPLKFVKAWK